MNKLFLAAFAACTLLSAGTALAQKKPHCTVVVASDLHFDMPPETDQFHHVVAINALGKTQKIDAVLLTGDIFDKAHPLIQALYRQRWEPGAGLRRIHYPVFPAYGNHDISPESGRPLENKRGYELNMAYMDSVLNAKKRRGEILNVDPSSRSYSFNIGGVHFVQGQLAAGDTSYCKSNFAWLEADLQRYASKGRPVVYLQHYGVDDWALQWWTKEQRSRLFALLSRYNLAAFFVGHTHQASLQYYQGVPVVQVNNAWDDSDGKASFMLLKIDGNHATIENYEVEDGRGHTRLLQPVLRATMPVIAQSGK